MPSNYKNCSYFEFTLLFWMLLGSTKEIDRLINKGIWNIFLVSIENKLMFSKL